MGMRETLVITDRITWWERCEWIKENCPDAQDWTNWDLWQLGQDDIIYNIREQDATFYYLRWA
jgi:hypothetical protein